MVGPTPSEPVLRYVQRINAGDSEALVGLTADEFVFTDVAGDFDAVTDEEGVRAFWDGYFTPYPDYRIYVEQVLTGGAGVAIFGRTTGSHVPLEIEARETVPWVAEVQGGKVASWRIYSSEGSERVQSEQEEPAFGQSSRASPAPILAMTRRE